MIERIVLSKLGQVLIFLDAIIAKRRGHKWLLRQILPTPVFSCNTHAATEIHSLTSHEDLSKYLLAIKTFLRFYPDVAVYVHSDGSLTPADETILKTNILGVRIVPALSHDAIEKKMGPAYARYLQRYHVLRKISDILLSVQGKRVVLLDSDVLFMNRPDEVISWIERGDTRPRFMLEHPADSMSYVLTMQGSRVSEALPFDKAFNSGLMCFVADVSVEEARSTFEMLQQYMEFSDDDPRAFYCEQMLFSLLMNKRGAIPFPLEHYKVIYDRKTPGKDEKMVHFTSAMRLSNFLYLVFRQRVISALRGEGTNTALHPQRPE